MFDGRFAKSMQLRAQATQAVEFLIQNLTMAQLTEADKASIGSIKILMSNPISDIGQRILDLELLNQILMLDLSRFSLGIPEILTYADIAIDGKLLGDKIPKEIQKVWMNLTPISQRKGSDKQLLITDIPTLCAQLTRAMLLTSYNDSSAWLTPKLSVFIIESYSMTISSLIRRMFLLNPDEFKMVNTLVAAYFAQRMNELQDKEYPELLFRCSAYGTIAEIKRTLDVYKDKRTELANDFTLDWNILDKLFREVGPERMKKFELRILTRMFTGSPVDSQAMSLAMDYPPYWVTEILKTASGTKIPQILNTLKLDKFKRELNSFVDELMRSDSFLRSINR